MEDIQSFIKQNYVYDHNPESKEGHLEARVLEKVYHLIDAYNFNIKQKTS